MLLRRIWLGASFIAAAVAAVLFYANLPKPFLAETSPMVLPVDPAPLVATTKDGERSFTVEIADDSGERARGLMFRDKMGEGRGMLFVFEATQPVGFWMKNTFLPLDLVFIGQDGI